MSSHIVYSFSAQSSNLQKRCESVKGRLKKDRPIMDGPSISMILQPMKSSRVLHHHLQPL